MTPRRRPALPPQPSGPPPCRSAVRWTLCLLVLTACEPAADLATPGGAADRGASAPADDLGVIDALIAELADQAPPRRHGASPTTGPEEEGAKTFEGGRFVPTYTLRTQARAPSTGEIREAVVDIERGLERWARDTGWSTWSCQANAPLAIQLVSHATLTSQTGNSRVIGQYSLPPEQILVAFDTGTWRSTLAHEMAHAAYQRCDWGTGSPDHSEQFARAFEVWLNSNAHARMQLCRGLFKNRRVRKGLCL